MHAFRRLSTGPTLPDLMRQAANADAARIARMMPLGVWCRPSTIPYLHGALLSARPIPPCHAARRSRPMLVMAEIRAWTLAAETVLVATRLGHRAGLFGAHGIGAGLTCSAWLAGRGHETWRSSRLVRDRPTGPRP